MDDDFLLDFSESIDDDSTSLPLKFAEQLLISNEDWDRTMKVLKAFEKNVEILADPFFKEFRKLGINLFLKSTSGSFYGGLESRTDYVKYNEIK